MNSKRIFGKRTLMVALLAGSGALVATSFAMPGGPGQGGCTAAPAQKAQTQREAFRAQRLAGLKEKLKLQPGQEAAWQTFAAASQPGTGRMDRRAMRDEFGKMNLPDRMDKMLSMMDERRARMAQRAEAVKQFYAQLTPEQRTVFDAEAMPLRHSKHHHHGGMGRSS